jgi:Arc/MetJ-type ribon-helix-helix transcriptional regulator
MENVKAYEAERDAIQEVIDTYERRAAQLGQDIASESEKALDDEDETTTSDSKKFRDDYAADIRDLVLNKNFEIESDVVQSLLAERQEKIDSDEKWSGMSNDELIKNIEADKKKKKVASMDTGGFTGVWGPEGKLAFLHQKELVLNEHDTDNMLNTVSMIRELVSMIDAGAAGSIISGLLSTPGFTNMLNHDFQQNVEIYAEFPSATDHSEIEQAFNNLLNTAS